ncbi:MAG: FHA domain-containing protein [Lachnospiraceae bacterium]|nr:FHA domain-containing protein [Lachnospiraceae bacterium]
MEVKYYKDFRNNYLILKSEEETENSYQCKMITENQIRGLLQCKERHINGEKLLYYDISSKQSLQSFCEVGYVTMDFLRRLFRQLKAVREEMAEYLLLESYLLLKPEFVFMESEKGDFSFVYFPYEPEENYMFSFMDYLTGRVDDRDEEALNVSYRILQLMEREQFVLDEVLQWFDNEYPTEKEIPVQVTDKQGAKDGWEEEELFEQDEEMPDISFNARRPRLIADKLAGGMVGLLLLFLVILYFLYQNYFFSGQRVLLFYVILTVVLLLLLICVIYLLMNKLFGLGKSKLSFGVADREKSSYTEDGRYEETGGFRDALQTYVEENKENVRIGNTVFIPWAENCENKLYGSGKGNKYHIDLTKLPLTVGKLAGSVDMVIPDAGISRRHVKFFRDGNRICMTDLNSTNGTFLNGLRLEPNMTEILEPGDEIRLGKLKFIYR